MGRVEEFMKIVEQWSRDHIDALRVSSVDVMHAVAATGTTIPLSYFLGTAKHESNFAVNERDTEENGFQSWGIWQLSQEEAKQVGMPAANLLELSDATRVFVKLVEEHRTRILSILEDAHLREPKDPEPKDLPAYMAIAHNVGFADATFKMLAVYGLDWTKWKARNTAQSAAKVARAQSAIAVAKTDQEKAAATAAMKQAQAYVSWVKGISAYGDDCLEFKP